MAGLNFLAGVNAIVFILLSCIHVYWALGGRWGSTAVIPTSTNEQPAFIPGKGITLIVALGLFSFAIITAGNLGLFSRLIAYQYFRYGMWGIVFIFFLRAIGDFRQIGFSKKIRTTQFAINDTKYYSPLCLYLATSSLVILLLHNA